MRPHFNLEVPFPTGVDFVFNPIMAPEGWSNHPADLDGFKFFAKHAYRYKDYILGKTWPLLAQLSGSHMLLRSKNKTAKHAQTFTLWDRSTDKLWIFDGIRDQESMRLLPPSFCDLSGMKHIYCRPAEERIVLTLQERMETNFMPAEGWVNGQWPMPRSFPESQIHC